MPTSAGARSPLVWTFVLSTPEAVHIGLAPIGALDAVLLSVRDGRPRDEFEHVYVGTEELASVQDLLGTLLPAAIPGRPSWFYRDDAAVQRTLAAMASVLAAEDEDDDGESGDAWIAAAEPPSQTNTLRGC